MTRILRDFSEKNVKITEADKTRSRQLVKDYIKGHIMEYFERNSPLPIQGLEHTGSVYERLKTETSDEVDFMVAAKTAKPVFQDYGVIPGLLLNKLVSLVTCISGSWKALLFTPLPLLKGSSVQSGSEIVGCIVLFLESSPSSDVCLHVRQHGPAVQLDITEKKTCTKLLSMDLVPSLETDAGEHFVPKPNKSLSTRHPDLVWRQSFSLAEKATLKKMDKDDHGCRHELFRIVKTLVQKEPTSFGALNSYHLKTALKTLAIGLASTLSGITLLDISENCRRVWTREIFNTSGFLA